MLFLIARRIINFEERNFIVCARRALAMNSSSFSLHHHRCRRCGRHLHMAVCHELGPTVRAATMNRAERQSSGRAKVAAWHAQPVATVSCWPRSWTANLPARVFLGVSGSCFNCVYDVSAATRERRRERENLNKIERQKTTAAAAPAMDELVQSATSIRLFLYAPFPLRSPQLAIA